jgi:hypothetical protein
MVPICILISLTILIILVFIPLLVANWSIAYIYLMSLLIALTTSATTLIISFYFPTHSPIFIFLLLFFLQASLPLPSPLGTMLALSVLTIHIIMIITIQPVIYVTSRIELVG